MAKLLCTTLSLAALVSPSDLAAASGWTRFDPGFPDDYIDSRSLVKTSSSTVRFWERAGSYPNAEGPDAKYPQYMLYEINCSKHELRELKWDLAIEARMTADALSARSKFISATLQLQSTLPTAWESLEPSAHDYARLEFVCGTSRLPDRQ